jgi:hypothetical protein
MRQAPLAYGQQDRDQPGEIHDSFAHGTGIGACPSGCAGTGFGRVDVIAFLSFSVE